MTLAGGVRTRVGLHLSSENPLDTFRLSSLQWYSYDFVLHLVPPHVSYLPLLTTCRFLLLTLASHVSTLRTRCISSS